jgi:hypothetical protein
MKHLRAQAVEHGEADIGAVFGWIVVDRNGRLPKGASRALRAVGPPLKFEGSARPAVRQAQTTLAQSPPRERSRPSAPQLAKCLEPSAQRNAPTFRNSGYAQPKITTL